MAKAKSAGILETIEVEPLRVGKIRVWIKGRTPFIFNRLAAHARRELLFPRGTKSKADREQTLKHDPMVEYRASMGKNVGGKVATRLQFPAPGVKGSMATAALETKGTNKTQIGRLIWVDGYAVDVYGVPEFFMSVVRSADMNKTPDIRTRAILREWCMPVTIQYVKPQLSDKTIMQLLSNGGIIVGVGDFRQEKGKGSFGQYEVATEAQCKSIINGGGMKAQDAAIKNPAYFDAESEELFSWFKEEVVNRGKEELLAA